MWLILCWCDVKPNETHKKHLKTQIKNMKKTIFLYFFLLFILHNSRCQVLCSSCKKLPRTSMFLYFSDLSGSLMPALFSVDYWVPIKPGGVRDVALYIIPHVQTQSNRVCSSLVILMWLMLPRGHIVSGFLYK
jgi:hypothetical protein